MGEYHLSAVDELLGDRRLQRCCTSGDALVELHDELQLGGSRTLLAEEPQLLRLPPWRLRDGAACRVHAALDGTFRRLKNCCSAESSCKLMETEPI